MSGVAFSSFPMNRPNQTESAVFDSCMSSVISKDPFSDCGYLNVSLCVWGRFLKLGKIAF